VVLVHLAEACGLNDGNLGSVDLQKDSAIRCATPIPGVDMGAEINTLYASLPATGGTIIVQQSAAFSTPILFTTKDKPALLKGLPTDIVNLTYTGTNGVAVTFDYGTGHRMGTDCGILS
jgi:hypothetical protein